jgi:DNA-binding MarR family transcriptional regulator
MASRETLAHRVTLAWPALKMVTMPSMPTQRQRSQDLTPEGGLGEAALKHIVGYQLAQATITTTEVFQSQVGGPFDLRPVEFTVLTLIHENPGVSGKQLARALAVTPPNITMWIDRLEARGLVARERSATDGRAQHLRATPQGAALARNAVQRLLDGERQAMAALSSAERAILVELLHKAALCRKTP